MKRNKNKLLIALSSLIMLGTVAGCSLQGPQGEQGLPGINGTDGKDGINGINGKDVTSVLTGNGEPSPSLGKKGDSYIDVSTWDYYFKGPLGWLCEGNIKGGKGDKGDSGKDGSSFFSGTGEPSPVLGNNGDSYIDTSTWNYYVKDSLGWKLRGNVKGDQGVKGDKGENGTDGIDGANGADGTDGTMVLTGVGKPSSALGKEGDSYIDTSTWNYYVKDSSGWEMRGNMKGGQGDKGDKGDKGDSGEAGANGTNGKTPYIGDNGNWWIDGTDTGVSATPTTYVPVIFNNYDGSMLYTFYFEKGSTASYNGPTPTKPSDYDGSEELPYTFIGWDKPLENIQEPTIFTAQYRCKMYDVTFANYDGTTLYSTQAERGHDASYVGEVPVRNDNPKLEWTFVGWDKPLTNITANMTFLAKFYAPNSIKCTFKNYDGTVLSTQYVGEGDSVTYEGSVPTKAEENNAGVITKYEFIGWDKSLKNITSDTVFIAQFGPNTYYDVTFVNYDDTPLYKTSTFKGGQVIYEGKKPTRSQEASGDNVKEYTFKDWDKPLTNISEPMIIKATYNFTSYTGYLVTFLDEDNTELLSRYFKKGTKAVYPNRLPFTYDSKNVKKFVGWSESLENVSGPLTVKAKYMTISREQNGEYPQSVVTDEALITSLNSLSTTNVNGYYEYAGEQYEKLSAHTIGSDCTFDNGESIIYGKDYYFKIEPIQWRYLSGDNDTAFFTSEYLLDTHEYDPKSNNYKKSSIRKWLNNDFLNKAFADESLIITTEVDNSFDNQYACETTYDKVFLLSLAELDNNNYWSSTSNDLLEARVCKATDYAMSKLSTGSYWTRSPSSHYSSGDGAWYVYSDGDIQGGGFVYDTTVSVRPGLSIKIA